MDETSTEDLFNSDDMMLFEDLLFEPDVFKNLFDLHSNEDFDNLVSAVTLEYETNELETQDDIQHIEDISNNNYFRVPNLQDDLLCDSAMYLLPTTSQQNHDNIQDLELLDNTTIELSEFIQLNQSEECIKVAMPKKSVNNLYHLSRNRSTPISVYYNISSEKRYLKIELLSGSPALEETIKYCKLSQKTTVKEAKHSSYWFLCNDNVVELGDFLQFDLNPQRNERCLSFKFACNTSCESMFNKTILKFSLIGNDNLEICQQSLNIRVSERPGRDERELIIKEKKEEIKKFSYPEDLPNFIKPSQIIESEVPKLKNHTAPNCTFEISLSNDNKKFKENKFCESVEKLVKFTITEATVENPSSALYVRAMIVDPKYPEKCNTCSEHGNSGELKQHILRSNNVDAIYQGTETGFYADKRFSVRTPCQPELSYSFMCNNTCWLDRDRTFAGLIFILEDEFGQMFARRYFKFAIVDRPNRTNLNYDSEFEVAATKRKSTDESTEKCTSAKKRQSIKG